jgi:thiamine-phosphate pyrophosphorylase
MIISPLHCLTWDNAPFPHLEQVKQLLDAGVNWIQLRQKNRTEREKMQTATAAATLCEKYKSILIINDSPQICLESGANGVHLGLKDCHVSEARKLLGEYAIIGGTANTPEQARQRKSEGCNYIGLGPWRTTQTKENLSEILGETGIKNVVDLNLKIPIIAIGGIALQDIEKIIPLGVQGIAVSSGIVAAENIKEAFKKYLEQVILCLGKNIA